MKAHKGFDKDLKCRGFQYEVGGDYTEESAELCNHGFHACENPLDTMRYYKPGTSRYCEVDVDDNGELEKQGLLTAQCTSRKKEKMRVYRYVTRDKYRLPIAQADSIAELAELLGLSADYVRRQFFRLISGKVKKSRYEMVDI